MFAQNYGYAKAEDPLVLGVKSAIGHARAERWEALDEAIASLDWQIKELREDIGVDLEPVIRKAVESRKFDKIAYAITQLVYQAFVQKLHWNEKEKLERYVPARARLDAAQFYYEEILSHAVRRADQSQKEQRHREVLRRMRKLRSTLGSPGLFGVGKREPDLAKFRTLAGETVTLLRAVYPDFLKGKSSPGKSNAKPDRPASTPKEDAPKETPPEKGEVSPPAGEGEDARE